MCCAPDQEEVQSSHVPFNNTYNASCSVHGSLSPRSLSLKKRARLEPPAPLQVHSSAHTYYSPDSATADMSDKTLALTSHSPRTFVPSDPALPSYDPLSPASRHGNSSQYLGNMARLQIDQHHAPFSSSTSNDDTGSAILLPSHLQRRSHQSFDSSILSSHFESRRQSQVLPKDDLILHGSDWTMPASLSAGYTSVPASNGYNVTSIPTTFDPDYRRASVHNFHTSDGQAPGSANFLTAVSHVETPAPLQRADYRNSSDGFISPYQGLSRPLTVAAAPLAQREPSFQSNAAFRQHLHSAGTPSFSPHGSSISITLPPSSPCNLGGARALATPLLSRSSRSSESSTWASVPSTPTTAATPSGGKAGAACPSMLTDALVSPRYGSSNHAPCMVNTRSYSMASLGSTGEGNVGSISMEGRGRSFSTSAVRNAARTRPRHSDPPLVVSSADKQHGCFCGKRFKRLEHLKRHSQVHTQARPFQCPIKACGRAFGRSDNLTQHLKTHARSTDQNARSTEETPPTDLAAQTDAYPSTASPLSIGDSSALKEQDHFQSTLASFAGNFASSLSQ